MPRLTPEQRIVLTLMDKGWTLNTSAHRSEAWLQHPAGPTTSVDYKTFSTLIRKRLVIKASETTFMVAHKDSL